MAVISRWRPNGSACLGQWRASLSWTLRPSWAAIAQPHHAQGQLDGAGGRLSRTVPRHSGGDRGGRARDRRPSVGARGRLRVTAPMSFGALHVAPPIAAYTARYSRVNIDLVLNDRLVDLVEEGYDLPYASAASPIVPSSRNASARRASSCARRRVISRRAAAHEAGRSRPSRMHPIFLRQRRRVWTFLGPNGEETVRVRGRVACNNGDAICHMATNGQGVTMQPDFIAAPHLRAGR